jgi:hypothetical protein
MKKFNVLLLMLLLGFSVFAQDDSDENYGFTLSLNTDAFFGLYPIASGYYTLSEKVDFTFYGIMWSDIPNGSGGFGSWTEFGVGANFKVADGKLGINPQLGILSGTLLSKSDRPVVGEGIVPNLTANLGTDKVEGQLYFGYYLPLFASNSVPTGIDRNSYTHYWLSMGTKLNFVSLGLHFEQLNQATGGEVDNINLYTWIGPYVAFNMGNGGSLRFAGGPNTSSDERKANHDGFFKMTFAYSF